jgi:hypothetical protein
MMRSRLIGVFLAAVLTIALLLAIILAAWQGSSIKLLITDIQTHYLAFTAALGALGTLSMAVIQTIKDLVPIMRWYQRSKTMHWLRYKAHESAAAAGGARASDDRTFAPREIVKERLAQPTSFATIAPDVYQAFHPPFDETDEQVALDAEADLLRLATAGSRRAFYDLPIEQLCGQMNTASQVVLDYPEQHSSLLRCLASLGAPADLSDFQSPALQTELSTLRKNTERDKAQEERLRELQQQLADIRARIANQIHRSVDAFQIATGYRWQWYLRTASFLISFVITAVAVRAGVGGLDGGSNWTVIVALGLMGGFLAPVTSDLQAIVRQIRTKA